MSARLLVGGVVVALPGGCSVLSLFGTPQRCIDDAACAAGQVCTRASASISTASTTAPRWPASSTHRAILDAALGLVGLTEAWINGNDRGDEGTFTLNEGGPLPFATGFANGQPDNAGGNEDRLELNATTNGYNDSECSAVNAAFCGPLPPAVP